MMYTVCNRHPLVEMCMLFVGTSIIHHSTEGIFILCNIWDLLIYSSLFKLLQPQNLLGSQNFDQILSSHHHPPDDILSISHHLSASELQ